mmetsp:Transcript_13099/g.23961  ORF Transcript_13099/g.23961 Transcript_13099/m.23961 type:complete len:210 (+) Transcript_13099:822-1451(+)
MPLMPPALTAPGLMQARLGPRAADPQRHAPHCLRSGPPSRSPRGLQRSARAGAQRLPGHWTPEAWVSPPSAASRPRCRERTWRSRPVRRSASPPSPPVPLCRDSGTAFFASKRVLWTPPRARASTAAANRIAPQPCGGPARVAGTSTPFHPHGSPVPPPSLPSLPSAAAFPSIGCGTVEDRGPVFLCRTQSGTHSCGSCGQPPPAAWTS